MAAILEVYFKVETLETMVKALRAKNSKGVSVTASVNDDVKTFTSGEHTILQNVSCFVSQTKEQREAKKDRFYVANGSVKWVSDTGVKVPVKDEAPAAVEFESDTDDLPF